MKAIETVGILGLGKMGGPIAGHLVARGFKVIGYDPVASAREQAAACPRFRSTSSARRNSDGRSVPDRRFARS